MGIYSHPYHVTPGLRHFTVLCAYDDAIFCVHLARSIARLRGTLSDRTRTWVFSGAGGAQLGRECLSFHQGQQGAGS